MKYVLLTIIMVVLNLNVHGQFWTEVQEKNVAKTGEKMISPLSFKLMSINDQEIKSILWSAPNQNEVSVTDSEVILPIALRNGIVHDFKIVEYNIMKPALAAEFPNIKTFIGIDIDNSAISARIDYTVHGFRAVINNMGDRTYIDHFQTNDNSHRIIYKKNELENNKEWSCATESPNANNKEIKVKKLFAGDCQFREYEIAIATTGEYSNYHGAFNASQSNLVHSAVVTSLNRVNDVYEIDASIRFVLIANNSNLYYYDSSTDPYTNNSGSTMLGENQTNIDNVIGNNNYDIGHVFSTGGGGVAWLGSLCNSVNKARGVTGQSNPVGDPFDIDYVAHEIGHQMGANHTQNNSCNRVSSTSMEPGSASTIMGYAGICSPNVQTNSDAFFHAISIQEMAAEILAEDANNPTCQDIIPWNNTTPTISPLVNKTLPISTPFVLEGLAVDAEMDSMTYTFDQMDPEVASMPPSSTNTDGPAFRAIFGTPEPRRYFPSIDNIVNNTTDIWEVLPSVSRNMDFRLTVRDFHNGQGGCTAEQDVSLSFDASSGPFEVTSQNSSQTYIEGEIITVSWDKANTDAAPVLCANVDIILSYDGGLTYEEVLVSNTPNDGTEDVTLPSGTTTTGRIMVKASDNYFFDINDSDFTINEGIPSFIALALPEESSICASTTSYSFGIATESIAGFSSSITLTTTQSPSGTSISYSQNPVTVGDTVIVTITNMNQPLGTYLTEVNCSGGGVTKSITHNVNVTGASAATSLLGPSNNSLNINTTPMLTWDFVADATSYEYELGTSSQSGNILNGIVTNNNLQITDPLSVDTDYFWRVRTVNDCGVSNWSAEYTFKTKSCLEVASYDVPLAISASGTPTVSSELNVKDRATITDLNVLNLVGSHTWIEDLDFTLIAPDNTSRAFWTDPCGQEDNFDINFDDEAATGSWPCPPTDGGTYQPELSLDVFDGKDIKGSWTLEVTDDTSQDGGTLEGWSLEFCISNYCDLTVSSSFGMGPGGIIDAINCAQNGDTVWIENTIPNQTIDLSTSSLSINKNITLYSENPVNINTGSNVNVLRITSGNTVEIVNVNFYSSEGDGILNQGNLILNNSNVTVPNNKTQFTNNGSVTIIGACNLKTN